MKLKTILGAIALMLINNEVITWAVLAAAVCCLALKIGIAMENANGGSY